MTVSNCRTSAKIIIENRERFNDVVEFLLVIRAIYRHDLIDHIEMAIAERGFDDEHQFIYFYIRNDPQTAALEDVYNNGIHWPWMGTMSYHHQRGKFTYVGVVGLFKVLEDDGFEVRPCHELLIKEDIARIHLVK